MANSIICFFTEQNRTDKCLKAGNSGAKPGTVVVRRARRSPGHFLTERPFQLCLGVELLSAMWGAPIVRG